MVAGVCFLALLIATTKLVPAVVLLAGSLCGHEGIIRSHGEHLEVVFVDRGETESGRHEGLGKLLGVLARDSDAGDEHVVHLPGTAPCIDLKGWSWQRDAGQELAPVLFAGTALVPPTPAIRLDQPRPPPPLSTALLSHRTVVLVI